MEKYTKGDTIQILCTVDEDITAWKIRASIKDASANETKIATLNSGGADIQIEKVTEGAISTFLLQFASGETTNFDDEADLEIEIDTGDTVGGEEEIYTFPKEKIYFENENIDWVDPSV